MSTTQLTLDLRPVMKLISRQLRRTAIRLSLRTRAAIVRMILNYVVDDWNGVNDDENRPLEDRLIDDFLDDRIRHRADIQQYVEVTESIWTYFQEEMDRWTQEELDDWVRVSLDHGRGLYLVDYEHDMARITILEDEEFDTTHVQAMEAFMGWLAREESERLHPFHRDVKEQVERYCAVQGWLR